MLLIPVSDITVGDFIHGFGTVIKVIENRDKDGKLLTVGFEYFNTQSALGLDPSAELSVTQGGPGGLKERMPDSSQIRPGLAADHTTGR